jgi:tryptophanase
VADRRQEIPGYQIVSQASVLRHFTAHMAPLR